MNNMAKKLSPRKEALAFLDVYIAKQRLLKEKAKGQI
jgi:hypothetical protein